MSSKKVIAVVGATGNQGRSVVKAFLPLPDWHVRGLTRDPSSSSAKALAEQGVEVVQAELADTTSLSRAFEGAHVIFLNTDFWLPYFAALRAGESHAQSTQTGFDTEFGHAKNATDAAAKVPNLHRFVYSALGPMKKASEGKYPHSGHWDSKAAVVDYIEDKVPALEGKAQFVYPAAYHTNAFLLPQQYSHMNKEWALLLPGPANTNLPVIETETTFGEFVKALILDEDAGVKLFAYDCNVTATEAVDTWNKVTGKNARFVSESLERMNEITGLPYEILDGPGFLGEYHFMHGVRGKVIEPKDLKRKVPRKSFEDILRERGMDDILGSKHMEF